MTCKAETIDAIHPTTSIFIREGEEIQNLSGLTSKLHETIENIEATTGRNGTIQIRIYKHDWTNKRTIDRIEYSTNFA